MFLAHSLGGVVLKRVLYYPANRADRVLYVALRLNDSLLQSANSGMAMSHPTPMVKGLPNHA
jgi:hypothetical protein